MFFLVVGDDGRLVGVEPSSEHVVAQGRLCVKGWNVHHFVNHPDRLTQPLIRRNGKLEPASWDEALDLVVSRLQAIAAAHGPDSLAFFSSAKTTNEENYLMMKLARAVFKTNNVDHCARLCHSSTVLGLAATFGSGAMTNSISCMEQADCILVIGSNTTEQHPLIGTRIVQSKTKRGAKLIVADNRRIRLARLADLHVRHKNGTDVAFLNGLMHVIISEGLENKEFVRTRTENYEELKKVVANYPPEKVAEICGVTPEEIVQTARMFAGSDRAMIVYSMGITQHTHGVDNVKTCANLAMLTGNIGRPGTGVNPLRGQNNVQGACDMGALPNVFTGYQGVVDPAVRAKFEKAWGVENLPDKVGLTVTTAIDAAAEDRLKALFIMGENPMMSDPDQNHVRKALEHLDFLVVQDIFPTPTTAFADVVLPATTYAEKDGTFTSTERRVQRVRKAIEPVGESRADWEILCEVARRAGYDRMQYGSVSEIFDEIASRDPHLRRHVLRSHRSGGTAVALPGQAASRHAGSAHQQVHPRPRHVQPGRVPAFAGAAGRRVSVRPQHRPMLLPLPHRDHDPPIAIAESRGAVPLRGDQPDGRSESEDSRPRVGLCVHAARRGQGHGPGHGSGPRRGPVHAVPLRRGTGQSTDDQRPGPRGQDPGVQGLRR